MKYLVVSDIHGSVSGAEWIPEVFNKSNAQAILLLGDVLYHGPRNTIPADYNPKKIIEILNPLASRILAVRGNCDAEVDQMVLKFPVTADYCSFMVENRRIFISHGHIYSPDHLPALKSGDVFLSGHTHIPTTYEKDGVYLLNPGSSGIPKGGHPATFGWLTEQSFRICTLDQKEYMSITFK